MIVGIICALFAYRAHFHSLFDYRNNHIPLPYHGSTRSFKQSDQPTKEKPGSTERIAGEEKVVYGVNNSLPDRHLAVRWPIGADEKRGSVSNKHPRNKGGESKAGNRNGSTATSLRSRNSGGSVESPVGSEVAEMV